MFVSLSRCLFLYHVSATTTSPCSSTPAANPAALARVAAGIASPRLSRLRLTRHPAYGSLGEAAQLRCLLAWLNGCWERLVLPLH